MKDTLNIPLSCHPFSSDREEVALPTGNGGQNLVLRGVADSEAQRPSSKLASRMLSLQPGWY
jgi:hypothetical protein